AIGLAIDSSGNAYVTGFTHSTNFPTASPIQETNAGTPDIFVAKLNSADIVSAQQFQVAPQGATSLTTEGKRTDPVFGYATAESIPGTPLAGLAIVNRMQNGATVSEVNVPAPPFLDVGRLFVDVSTSGRSVLSIANPNDDDVTVDFVYTDDKGNSSKFATVDRKSTRLNSSHQIISYAVL